MLSLIPVIDIYDGLVVHGKKGDRTKYQPIHTFSKILSSSEIQEVIEILKNFTSGMFYIADLDSITKKSKNNFPLLKKIINDESLQFLIDGGFRKAEDADFLLANDNILAAFGTETIDSYAEVEKAVDNWGEERIVPSIDFHSGKILSSVKEITNSSPSSVLKRFETIGISKSIILELSSVGSEQKNIPQQIKNLVKKTHMAIISGGGVKEISDIEKWDKIGVKGLLIATALHSGKVTLEALKNLEEEKIIKL